MAFDQSTRNRLQRFVGDARTLLTEECTRQLQHEYGMNPVIGEVAELATLAHMDDTCRETARLLRDTLTHYLAISPSNDKKNVLERIGRKEVEGYLIPEVAPQRQTTLFDFADLPDRTRFWNRAEQEILAALKAYAEHAEGMQATQKLLFAQDAAKGFAFIDLCRKQFDVVLMNPPFGEASRPSKASIDAAYPRTKNDVYAAFVERGLSLLKHGGMLGAITSRTGFFLSSFQKWREDILLHEARPTVFADLGHGVLDTAMVETAAYCLEAVGRADTS